MIILKAQPSRENKIIVNLFKPTNGRNQKNLIS